MAYWYPSLGYGTYQGQEINYYQLIILHRQGVSYVVVRGE